MIISVQDIQDKCYGSLENGEIPYFAHFREHFIRVYMANFQGTCIGYKCHRKSRLVSKITYCYFYVKIIERMKSQIVTGSIITQRIVIRLVCVENKHDTLMQVS